jgi:hypothetical protein
MAAHRVARRSSRLTAGLSLLTLTFAGTVAAIGPTTAQAVEDDAGGAPSGEMQPLEITESALYASPVTDAIPPTLTTSVPPEAVCVVRPDLCPEESEPVRNALVDAFATVQGNAPVEPVHPVPEGSAAVSYFGGHPRYQTAIRFELPPVPDGEEVFSFTLELDQGQPSYDLNSPAFRRVVLGAFSSIGPQDPSFAVEGLIDALSKSALEVDGDVIGVEACPLLSPFEPAGAPQAAHSDELPQREVGEDETEVDVDCILGSTGVRGEDGTWSFDLTFAAAAWAAGDIQNHGVLLRPSGAPNLAFGDPDTSTSAQVVLELDDVRYAMETAEAFDEMGFDEIGFEDGATFEEAGFEDDGFGDAGFDDGGMSFDADAPMDAGFSDAPDLDAEFADGDLDAAPLDGEDPAVAAPVDARTAGGSNPVTPWWLWLLVPTFFGGAYLTSQALMAPAPATGTATTTGGALSRLIAQRRIGAGPMQQV